MDGDLEGAAFAFPRAQPPVPLPTLPCICNLNAALFPPAAPDARRLVIQRLPGRTDNVIKNRWRSAAHLRVASASSPSKAADSGIKAAPSGNAPSSKKARTSPPDIACSSSQSLSTSWHTSAMVDDTENVPPPPSQVTQQAKEGVPLAIVKMCVVNPVCGPVVTTEPQVENVISRNACVYICIYIYVYIDVYIYIQICVCIYIYAYIQARRIRHQRCSRRTLHPRRSRREAWPPLQPVLQPPLQPPVRLRSLLQQRPCVSAYRWEERRR